MTTTQALAKNPKDPVIQKPILKFRLEFDDDMKLSMNKVWSWWPWTQWVRKKSADIWHEDVWQFLEWKRIPKIKEKVDIFLTFYFSTWDSGGKRQLDSSNCSAMGKMIEDSLKYDKKKNPKWILVDDTNDCVGWFALKSAEMTIAERRELETSFVDVEIRSHIHNL